jgi:hypothetical protein
MLASYLRRTIACLTMGWAVMVIVLWQFSPAVAILSTTFAPVLLAVTLALQCLAALQVNRQQTIRRPRVRHQQT